MMCGVESEHDGSREERERGLNGKQNIRYSGDIMNVENDLGGMIRKSSKYCKKKKRNFLQIPFRIKENSRRLLRDA